LQNIPRRTSRFLVLIQQNAAFCAALLGAIPGSVREPGVGRRLLLGSQLYSGTSEMLFGGWKVLAAGDLDITAILCNLRWQNDCNLSVQRVYYSGWNRPTRM